MNSNKRITFCFIFFIINLITLCTNVVAQEKENFLLNELVTRHANYTRESLISVMGSEDELVGELLNLRRSSKPPVLGPRCEKLLISFSDRDDVKQALLDDVKSDSFFGLTSIILSSLEDIQDVDFRRELVKEALGNSKVSSSNTERYKAIINDLPAKVLD